MGRREGAGGGSSSWMTYLLCDLSQVPAFSEQQSLNCGLRRQQYHKAYEDGVRGCKSSLTPGLWARPALGKGVAALGAAGLPGLRVRGSEDGDVKSQKPPRAGGRVAAHLPWQSLDRLRGDKAGMVTCGSDGGKDEAVPGASMRPGVTVMPRE